MALAVGIGNPGLSMTSASCKPDATITITHNRDQMMCQQHLTLLVLPSLQGIVWPSSDLTPPTNAWPLGLTKPSRSTLEGSEMDHSSPPVARSESCRGQRAHRMPVQTFEARSLQEGKT
jgi:hypothetical protein